MFKSKDPNPELAWWYLPGHQKDSEIYATALRKCKEINQELNPDPFGDKQRHHGRLSWGRATKSRVANTEQPQAYDASRIKELVEQETDRVQKAQDSRNGDAEWTAKVKDVAYGVIRLTQVLKPVIDVFVPHSPEYTVPYACVWIVFKGFLARREKKDSIPDLIKSLSEDLPIFDAYRVLAPTDLMKTTLAELYIHGADFLWRLSEYYSYSFFGQLTDGLLPRTKYNFSLYQANVKRAADRLKTICELGNMAKQDAVKNKIDWMASTINVLSERLEGDRLAQAQHTSSDLIDIWDDEVGDVEHELRLWGSLRFSTAARDHWSQNGILGCLSKWRALCEDESNASILWICSEGNGRQAWMTEFSLDLVRVCRAQGQPVTFALCDRPKAKWTPKQVLKQLIAQLLHQNPEGVLSNPSVFSRRSFRRATTFQATLDLLLSVIGTLESLVIVIDRLDLCAPDADADPAGTQQPDTMLTLALALTVLMSTYPQSLRILVSSARTAGPQSLPGLPFSFAKVNTRRRPRKRYYEYSPAKEQEDSDDPDGSKRGGRRPWARACSPRKMTA